MRRDSNNMVPEMVQYNGRMVDSVLQRHLELDVHGSLELNQRTLSLRRWHSDGSVELYIFVTL